MQDFAKQHSHPKSHLQALREARPSPAPGTINKWDETKASVPEWPSGTESTAGDEVPVQGKVVTANHT